jgi:LemA protein
MRSWGPYPIRSVVGNLFEKNDLNLSSSLLNSRISSTKFKKPISNGPNSSDLMRKCSKIRHAVGMMVLILAWLLGGCGYNQLQQLEENAFAGWDQLDAALGKEVTLAQELTVIAAAGPLSQTPALARLSATREAAAAYPISVEELTNIEVMAHLQHLQEALAVALAELLLQVARDPALATDPGIARWRQEWERASAASIAARHRYNQEAERFNTAIREFPFSLTNRILLRLEPKVHYTAKIATELATPWQPSTDRTTAHDRATNGLTIATPVEQPRPASHRHASSDD